MNRATAAVALIVIALVAGLAIGIGILIGQKGTIATSPATSSSQTQNQPANNQQQLYNGSGNGGGETPTAPQPPPTLALPVVSGGAGCPQARDLGPWAPSSSGQGQNFEVTASDTADTNRGSNGVVLGLWWPHGRTDWGNKEVTTFVPRGLSIEVVNGGGRGWDYEQVCALSEIQSQMEKHMADRAVDTNYHGFVHVNELVNMRLVRIRFDRRAPGSDITPSVTTPPSSGNQPSGGIQATKLTNTDNMVNIPTPTDQIYSVEAWGGQFGKNEVFVVIPAGQTVTRTWQGGALWSYPTTDIETVLNDLRGRGRDIYVVENGKLVKRQ